MFEMLGYPLTERSGIPSALVAAAEKELGVRLPASLRDYYLVAGRERRFNRCLNRLLSPGEWSVDKRHLLFMEENQRLSWWGVSLRSPVSGDPPVYRGINDEPVLWCREHRKCSVFLAAMLHYHAVSGGFPFCGQGDAPEETDYRFEKNGWTWRGEANSLSAYGRQDEVVCLMPPGDMPFMQRWSVLAGAKSMAKLKALAEEIGVTLS
jgi:hypothetical protein